MRILVISQLYYPEPFRVHEICEELHNRGHEVTVITGQPNYPEGIIYDGFKNERKTETINGVKVIRTKIRPRKTGNINLLRNYLSFWKNSKKAVKFKEEFDVVYVYQLSPVLYLDAAKKYAKKHDIKIVCYTLDLWPESLCARGIKKNSIIYKWFLRISKKLYNACDEIVITSPSFKEYFEKVINYKRKIVYLPQHYIETANNIKIDEERKINIVYAGNIGFAQNIRLLIKVAKRIPNVVFNIYGSGSEYGNCLEEARNVNNVVIHGRVRKEEIDYLNASACYLSLSGDSFLTKTIPGKIQEYMAMGKPILASINDDAKSIIQEANCGLVCIPDSEEELYKMIYEFTNNIEKYKYFKENAREYYLNNFTLDKHISELEKILNEVK